ncbi:MAG: RagB/SusD family nutrient uptake outer membrane protein [Bacteroidaceae bacterium]|nr:RagB/SusD family nutrient uptake outer membrane protein [Bacteroidaceae bacterium]
MFDDFLTVYPTNQITGEQFWEDKNDLTSVLASAYRQMSLGDVANRMIVWGEARSDNFILLDQSNENLRNIENANLLPTNSWFSWAAFYKGIGYCNLILSKGMEVVDKDPSFAEGDWLPIAAECKALRALYYFYLVRAFRDVPLSLRSNDTSEGVREPVPQTASETILTFLINDLEACKDDGMENYGNDVYNRSRITKDAIYTILADIYMWRACKNASPDSQAVYGNQYVQDLQKVAEYSDYVIGRKLYDFQKERETYYGQTNQNGQSIPLPILVPRTTGNVEDTPYNSLFGEKYSRESIFEIAHTSSSGQYNTAVDGMYGAARSGRLSDGTYGASSVFQTPSLLPNADNIAYSQTDLRQAEAVQYASSAGSSTTQIIKYLASEITVRDATNVFMTSSTTPNVVYGSYQNHDVTSANWILYRSSDVILLKAEAIARLGKAGYYAEGDPILTEAFDLTNAIFTRSNPLIENRYRLLATNFASPTSILEFVMRERQREFFAEGKRWFDLVRIAMSDGSNQNMLNLLSPKYNQGANAIKAKLATLNSLFNPVYKEEIKVNPALVQNPIWDIDETIQRN